jgi:hypothetical protein
MHCDHCCFSCTGKGTFMSQAVFDKCLALCKEFSWDCTLGGGEPTLHPKILDWTMQAALATIETSMEMDGPAVLVITNGKKTETAIKLAQLGHLGVIGAELSQDPWHDEIEERVIKEFTRYNKPFRSRDYGAPRKGNSTIRDVSENILARGRAIENDLSQKDQCACNSICIDPSGDFYRCGCRITKLGNILVDEIPQVCFDHPDECEKDLDRSEYSHDCTEEQAALVSEER